MKIENVEDLEQLLTERDEKLKDHELRLQLMQRLIDQMQGVLIDAGLAERRPKEDPGLAN